MRLHQDMIIISRMHDKLRSVGIAAGLLFLFTFCFISAGFARTNTEQSEVSDYSIAQYQYSGARAFLEMVLFNGRPANPQEFRLLRIIRQGRQFYGQPGMLLYPQDLVITSPGIIAVVMFSPEVRMAVLPNSQCTILVDSTKTLLGKFFVWISPITMYSRKSGEFSPIASWMSPENLFASENPLLLAALDEQPSSLPQETMAQQWDFAQRWTPPEWLQKLRDLFTVETTDYKARAKRTQFLVTVEPYNTQENVDIATWEGTVEVTSRWNHWAPLDVEQFQQVSLYGPNPTRPMPAPIDPGMQQEILNTIGTLWRYYAELAQHEQSPIQMPYLVGRYWQDAIQQLQALGLGVQITEVEAGQSSAGTVVGQYPQAGTSVIPGNVAQLTVAKSPSEPRVCVPSVIGMAVDAAISRLQSARLRIGQIINVSSNNREEYTSYYSQNSPYSTYSFQNPPATRSIVPVPMLPENYYRHYIVIRQSLYPGTFVPVNTLINLTIMLVPQETGETGEMSEPDRQASDGYFDVLGVWHPSEK